MSNTFSDLADLVGMGPSAHHRSPDEITQRLRGRDARTTVTAAVRITLHRPR